MKGIKKDQQDIDLWSAGDALVLKALGIVPAKLAPEVFNPGAGNQGLLSTFLTVPDCFPHYDTASCAGVTTCEKHVDNAVA